jgi:tRNA(Ile)-lysidine synthase
MAARAGLWRRPLLALPRVDVQAAATEMLGPIGRAPWSDPHNSDQRYARVRVRQLLAGLVADLGPGVVLGLTRSADQLRADADALDAISGEAFRDVMSSEDGGWRGDCARLGELPAAIRTRVIRRAALECGCPADALDYEHVRRIDDLVVDWHGQGEIRLPGGVRAERACGRLCLIPSSLP